MEQTPSSPGRSPELPSVSPLPSQERGGAFSNPETTSGNRVERQEQHNHNDTPLRAEQVAAPSIAVPAPVAPPVDDTPVAATPTVTSPTIANDDDLIEKEWVDKAKKVIAETKDDPYRREQEVNRLQADYLAKRYGRQLGLPQ